MITLQRQPVSVAFSSYDKCETENPSADGFSGDTRRSEAVREIRTTQGLRKRLRNVRSSDAPQLCSTGSIPLFPFALILLVFRVGKLPFVFVLRFGFPSSPCPLLPLPTPTPTPTRLPRRVCTLPPEDSSEAAEMAAETAAETSEPVEAVLAARAALEDPGALVAPVAPEVLEGRPDSLVRRR